MTLNADAVAAALAEISSADPDVIIHGLLRLSLSELDFREAQRQALHHASHIDDGVRGIAILCLGHIARVYGQLDLAAAEPLVRTALKDASNFVRGHADSAREDIRLFLKAPQFGICP